VVDVVQRDARNTTIEVVVILAAIAILFAFITFYIVNNVTDDQYAAGYYTIAALFDAVGIAQSGLLSSSVPVFSVPFYEIVSVSILDGLIKIIIVGFFIAALINVITSIDISSRIIGISKRKWKDHIVICGFSMLAEKVALELESKKIPFVIVDKDQARADEIRELGYIALHEDFTTDIALKNASVSTAQAIMFLTVSDYDNLLGVITAKHLNSKIKIIARVGDSAAVTKIHRAGAELCVVPEVLAGIDLGDAILKNKK
jgi:hypothetical protein